MNSSRRRFLERAALVGAIGAGFLREDAIATVRGAVRAAGEADAQTLAGDESFWFQIQQAYAIDRSLINLNNGGVSPSPRVALDAMRRHIEFANHAPSRHLWQIQDPQVETVRARLARVFGCDTEEMAITRNASESLQICQYGIDLKPGDEVLATSLDYPRMINTFRQRELREGIRLVEAPVRTPVASAEEVLEAYRRAITPRTRIMLCSHVVFLTGQIMPVREIVRLGREHGVPVIVDGAHAFAHLVFRRDDLECDYYGTSLHKWLTAPHGTGFLYVRKERIAALWPLMAAIEPKSDDIRKFEEIGTHSDGARLAIAEALTLYQAIGPERKAARFRFLRDRWARRLMESPRVSFLANLDDANIGGFTTMVIDGIEGNALAEHLWRRHRIVVAPIRFDDHWGIRVTPNVYTTADEVDIFAEAIEAVLANGRAGLGGIESEE